MDNYSIYVTPHVGFEDEILRIRNANRSVAQNREYLDWRYSGLEYEPAPIVFWIRSEKEEENVGMASLIFRPYYIDGKHTPIAALGDISLDKRLRGLGIGRKLLGFIKKFLEEQMPQTPAFVIPTESAYKSLISVNWRFVGNLVPYVMLIDPAVKLSVMFKSRIIAKAVSSPFSALIALNNRLRARSDIEMRLSDTPDAEYDDIWRDFPKDKIILRDHSVKFLSWRYVKHPHEKFRFAGFEKKGCLCGYIIFSSSLEDNTITIYDILFKDNKDLISALAIFIKSAKNLGDISSIRMPLGDNHLFCRDLWKTGFIRRAAQAPFLAHFPENFSGSNRRWLVTLGDKDI